MSRPILGKVGDRDVTIDVEQLVATRLLVQANSGGGKSWILRRILEQTHGKVPHLVLALEGEFHTLREQFDYVLAGRDGGDCPAHPNAAAALARRFLELGVSAIVDLSDLHAGERYAFVRLFLTAMLDAPRTLWHPTLVVIDEAHKFCSENREERQESYAAVVDLATRGRKRGFGCILATQRLSSLAKGAAAECNNVLVGRTILDVDVKRAAGMLGLSHADARDQLRNIDPGQFHGFGPAFSFKGVEIVRSGVVVTTHPKAGARAVRVTPPPDKVKAVLAELASIPREAEKEAQDLAGARAQVRELKAELRKAQAGQPKAKDDPSATARAILAERKRADTEATRIVNRLFGEADAKKKQALRFLDGIVPLLAKAREAMGELRFEARPVATGKPAPWNGTEQNVETLNDVVQTVDRTLSEVAEAHAERASSKGEKHDIPRGTSRFASSNEGAKPQGIGDLRRPLRNVLDAIAWLESAGVPSPYLREPVAAVAGLSPRSSNYSNLLGSLSSGGLIDYPEPGKVALTDAGRAAANVGAAPTTAEELHRRLESKLRGPQWKVLRPLLESYPMELSREALAEAAGLSATSSNFSNLVGSLSSLAMVHYPKPGRVAARRWLFLETE